MAEFNKDHLDSFLGAVRKYMQIRGNYSQKDLAELIEAGVSTISRFLSKKTKDLDMNLIAKIVAKLDIPLHEIIDFVDEKYNDHFIRLVKFYRGDEKNAPSAPPPRNEDDELADSFQNLGTADKNVKASVKIGSKRTTIPFTTDEGSKNSQSSIKDKLSSLSPRQKAYLTDFLNLDVEGRDLMVDLGNSLFRYFKMKGMEF